MRDDEDGDDGHDDEGPSRGPDTAATQVLPVDPDVTVGSREAARARSLPLRRQVRRTLVSRWDILLVIAAGGALGSVARWALGQALTTGRGHFPWATFAENVSGGLALGVLMVFVIDVWPPSRYLRPFLGVGVLGGFTTFSTYMLDTRALVVAHRGPLAAVYLFGTLAVGVAAVFLGLAVARWGIANATRRKLGRRARRGPHHRDTAIEEPGTRRQP